MASVPRGTLASLAAPRVALPTLPNVGVKIKKPSVGAPLPGNLSGKMLSGKSLRGMLLKGLQ